MTAVEALRRALTARNGRHAHLATAERLRATLAAQTRLSADLTRACAAKDTRIAELEIELAAANERIKAGKAREGTLTGLIVSVLWQRGEAAHEARQLRAVTQEVDGGEAA